MNKYDDDDTESILCEGATTKIVVVDVVVSLCLYNDVNYSILVRRTFFAVFFGEILGVFVEPFAVLDVFLGQIASQRVIRLRFVDQRH